MTLLRLSPRALTRCRFAISPLAETVGTLLELERISGPPAAEPDRHGMYSQVTHSQVTHSQVTHSQVTHSQVTHSQVTHGDATQSHTTHDQGTHGQVTQSHATHGHATQGHITRGQGTRGHATQSQVTPTQGTQGHITQSHITQGHITQGHPGSRLVTQVPAARSRAEQLAFLRWRDRTPVRRGLLDLSARTKWLPDVLAIPPAGDLRTRLSDELTLVAAFTDDEVRETIALAVEASWGSRPDTTWTAETGLAGQIADDLADGWERFVRADWPRRRAILERDIAYRTELLAADGWRAVVATIAKNTAWATDDAIAFGRPGHPDRIIDDGIIFVPHTQGSGTWSCELPPPRFALSYPARGRAAAVDPAATADLARLVGAGRSRVLLELRVPATSTELARILAVSLGTVSSHLAALRAAAVVDGVRSGRTVRYRLNTRGYDLLAAFGVPPSTTDSDQARSSGADE